MDPGTRRVELVLPMRTVLLVAAALLVLAAFATIGDTFLIVFVGIFLGLVFEYPVRFVMEKTRLSRGLAATVTVLGTALALGALLLLLLVPLVGSVRDFLQDLPATVQQLQDSDELDFLGDTGAAENTQEGANTVSEAVPDAISAVLGVAGDFFSLFLIAFTILFICLFLLTDVGNLKRSLGSVLAPGDEERWLRVWETITALDLTVGDRGDRDRRHRRHDPGGDGMAARLQLCHRAGRDRGAPRHDPQHRRDTRGIHPRAHPVGRGGRDRGHHHAHRAAGLPADREQRPHTEDPGEGRQPLRPSSSSSPSLSSAHCSASSGRSPLSRSRRRSRSSCRS